MIPSIETPSLNLIHTGKISQNFISSENNQVLKKYAYSMLDFDAVIFSFSVVSKTQDIDLLQWASTNNYQIYMLVYSTIALFACTLISTMKQ